MSIIIQTPDATVEMTGLIISITASSGEVRTFSTPCAGLEQTEEGLRSREYVGRFDTGAKQATIRATGSAYSVAIDDLTVELTEEAILQMADELKKVIDASKEGPADPNDFDF